MRENNSIIRKKGCGDMSINVTEDSIKSVSGILSKNEEYMYKLNSSIQQAKERWKGNFKINGRVREAGK